jgi:hypothetical protein
VASQEFATGQSIDPTEHEIRPCQCNHGSPRSSTSSSWIPARAQRPDRCLDLGRDRASRWRLFRERSFRHVDDRDAAVRFHGKTSTRTVEYSAVMEQPYRTGAFKPVAHAAPSKVTAYSHRVRHDQSRPQPRPFRASRRRPFYGTPKIRATGSSPCRPWLALGAGLLTSETANQWKKTRLIPDAPLHKGHVLVS